MERLPDNRSESLRPALLPVLERSVQQRHCQRLRRFGGWARGCRNARDASDPLIEGLEGLRVLDADDRAPAARSLLDRAATELNP
ncbi:MAG: hypothetical protein RLZZ124_484 [Cyanobacteriota bacterium]